MSELRECPCCGYPHDKVEAAAMRERLKEIKADAVIEAMQSISDLLDWDWDNVSAQEYCELLNDQANKIKQGDL